MHLYFGKFKMAGKQDIGRVSCMHRTAMEETIVIELMVSSGEFKINTIYPFCRSNTTRKSMCRVTLNYLKSKRLYYSVYK